ncbi:putative membrane protein [Bacillus methanolicus MGA3]|uniref:Putative membrane protein n=1 Tax=Bacillus methanolicus (strain MGA3 / ATCC 53907) TaxID=796606 RepID=A0A068LNP6_BACMM|nr:putative membrane protein [Bacillus methanolicus MGA3]
MWDYGEKGLMILVSPRQDTKENISLVLSACALAVTFIFSVLTCRSKAEIKVTLSFVSSK